MLGKAVEVIAGSRLMMNMRCGGAPRRLRTSTFDAKSWSLTIGPSNSDSDGVLSLEEGHDRMRMTE